MDKLSSKSRNKLPASSFGMPGERKYPMPDASHARNAKARASEMEHKGRISGGAKEAIDRKADRKLGGAGMAHTNVRNQKSHMDKMRGC